MPARVEFQQTESVATVTLCHSRRFNAMSRGMWRDLREVFVRIQSRTDLRCVLMAGHGAHFCAGGDISEYPAFRFDPAQLRVFHEDEVWGALSAMLACDIPVVAQIAGNCMGAGMELASCCDIRLAAESAQFGAPIARLGFPMAPREAALLESEAGLTTVRQMLLEAAVFSASEMLQRGFLSRVAADVDLTVLASSTVERIASLSPQAARLNKRTLRALHRTKLTTLDAAGGDEDLQRLMSGAYAYAESREHREGVTAFLEKRAPQF